MFWKKIKEQIHTHTWESCGYHSGKIRWNSPDHSSGSAYLYNFYYCPSCWEYKVSFGWNTLTGKIPPEHRRHKMCLFPDTCTICISGAVFKYIESILEEVRDDFLSEDYNYNYSI